MGGGWEVVGEERRWEEKASARDKGQSTGELTKRCGHGQSTQSRVDDEVKVQENSMSSGEVKVQEN